MSRARRLNSVNTLSADSSNWVVDGQRAELRVHRWLLGVTQAGVKGLLRLLDYLLGILLLPLVEARLQWPDRPADHHRSDDVHQGDSRVSHHGLAGRPAHCGV